MKKVIILLLILVPFLWVSGCKEDKDDKDNQTDSTTVNESKDVRTFYLVPSPEDVFGFADDDNLKFDKELLNPRENLSKYNDVKLQEFNFGVYAADLAFCAAANKNDETVSYLKTVRELSQDIGLADVFNESLVYRIEHVTPIKDSLIALSNDTYFDIMRYLEKNDRKTTLSIMAAGGWLECMYLVVSQTEYSKTNPSIHQIADQKIIVTNLWKFLEQNEDDPNVKAVKDELKEIYKIYNSLQPVSDENQDITTTDDEDAIVVGGNSKYIIEEAQYKQLKKYIIEARNKLTLNDVTL